MQDGKVSERGQACYSDVSCILNGLRDYFMFVQSVFVQQFQTKRHKPNKHLRVHRIKSAPFSCAAPEVLKRINLKPGYYTEQEQFAHLFHGVYFLSF